MTTRPDPFNALATLDTSGGAVRYYDIGALTRAGVADVGALPYTVRILLENLLRRFDGEIVTQEDIVALAQWSPSNLVAARAAVPAGARAPPGLHRHPRRRRPRRPAGRDVAQGRRSRSA